VDQGFTLFVVSWVNPDASYADVGMDDYVKEGYLEPSRGEGDHRRGQINAVGYCIAGTTLSLTLALMASAATSLGQVGHLLHHAVRFSDQGEVGVFLTDDFVDGIEREVAEKGLSVEPSSCRGPSAICARTT
jgi:polyhydroxyalkanoate synthase subunit PhaC